MAVAGAAVTAAITAVEAGTEQEAAAWAAATTDDLVGERPHGNQAKH